MSRVGGAKNGQKNLSEKQRQRLERAWDAYESGDLEAAGRDAQRLLADSGGHPETHMLLAAVFLETGNPYASMEELDRCRGLVEDRSAWNYYRGWALFDTLDFPQAAAEFRRSLEDEPEWTPAIYGLAEALEFLGSYGEAEELYLRAAALDPKGFPQPARLAREEFEGVVSEAVARLPEGLRRRLGGVALVVSDLPSPEALTRAGGEPPLSPELLGLFVGPSQKDMSVFAPVTFPPTIFIYQRNLERSCKSRGQLIEEIQTTIIHELGHFLGLSEEDLAGRGLE